VHYSFGDQKQWERNQKAGVHAKMPQEWIGPFKRPSFDYRADDYRQPGHRNQNSDSFGERRPLLMREPEF
jgi:hypothetical protein